jgi:hypothetical protein
MRVVELWMCSDPAWLGWMRERVVVVMMRCPQPAAREQRAATTTTKTAAQGLAHLSSTQLTKSAQDRAGRKEQQ